MTNRVTYGPQDFQKMCRQAERDHESRKLVVLLDRVKKQIAKRDDPQVELPKPPLATANSEPCLSPLPIRSVPLER